MTDQASVTHEIIIVRRNGGDGDGGHHGGAWKIAYADFVTAMMAFFLVMWLVNSANEVTKSRVASYFNPIKMTDSVANSRGLKNPTDKKVVKEKIEATVDGEGKTKLDPKQETEAKAEQKLLENPFSAMDEILLKVATEESGMKEVVLNGKTGDLFDPKSWEALRNEKANAEKKIPAAAEEETQTAPEENNASTSQAPAESDLVSDADTNENTSQLENTLKKLVEKHKDQLDISVDVRRTEEGLLIQLGDNSGKGMFAIGSAEPGAGLIEIVGVIGKLMSEQAGDVVVRGHTDGRRYKKGRRDNWQLSTARAHMASYMLMRGGLDERRIKRIEGHGAAKPHVASDPFSDANRRVEFLLQSEGKKP